MNAGCTMPSILLVRANNGLFGGIETQLLNLAIYLNANTPFEPILVTSPGANPLAERFAAANLRVETARFRPHGTFIQSTNDLRKLIERLHPTIVQSHMLRESFVARAACAGQATRHIFRVHTYIDCSSISSVHKFFYHLTDCLTQQFVWRYSAINDFAVQELRRRSHINSSKILRIPDGVDGMESPPPDMRTPSHATGVAMIANLVQGKGHATLLEALAHLRHLGIEMPAVFFGRVESTTTARDLEELANSLGVRHLIRFAGWTEDVWSAMDNIDVVVLPSLSEGTPNCLLEAMARGKLVVASSVGGIPEFVTHTRTGWLHPPNDGVALAEVLQMVFSTDPAAINRIRANAWSAWSAQYSSYESVRAQYAAYFSDANSGATALMRE